MSKVSAVPHGMHAVTPQLVFQNCSEALVFYAKAFGAVETLRAPDPSGKKIFHGSFTIGDSTFFCSDEFPEMGVLAQPARFWIYGENIDSRFQRAVEAGAQAAMPPNDAFWGDRFGIVTDPFGHRWTLAQRTKDLSPAELKAAQDAFFAQMKQQR